MSLQVFQHDNFGQIRTVNIDSEVWFVGKDITDALGYKNARDAIKTHVDREDKGRRKIDTLGGVQEMTVVNESGLYALTFGSNLPAAKEFKRWVTADVIPSIRKTGGYIAGQENMTDDELMAKALLVAQQTIERRNAVIKRLEEDIEGMRPKEIFADSVASSHTSILIGELAKILKQNGVDMGQNRLFKWMRDNGFIMKNKNIPTQSAMDKGLFEIKESTLNNPDGSTRITQTTKVTGKGQIYFVNRFLGGAV